MKNQSVRTPSSYNDNDGWIMPSRKNFKSRIMYIEHKERLKSKYSKSDTKLDIPDKYGYMDEELVELVKASVEVDL